MQKIYDRIRNADAAVLKANEGKQSAQLSIAYVASTFCNSLLQALDGKSGVSDVAYVESNVLADLKFFSSNVNLKKQGIEDFQSLPEMSQYEKGLLQQSIPDIKQSIEHGIKYAQGKKAKK